MNGSSYMVNENLNIIASSSPINLTNIVNTNYSKDSSGTSSLDSNADLLKCGSCLTEFLLSDIVIFIQHKTKNCKQFDPCDLNKIGRNRDKENYLRCNLCSESFGSAYNLLEHIQYSHKIELFKEITSSIGISSNFQDTTNFNSNCNLSSKSMRNKTLSGTFQTTTQLIPNNSTTNIGLNLSKSNTSSKEIFIDVIPSDPTIDFSDKNQSYNITVSSNSSTSSSSISSSSSNNKLSHSQTINESILKDKQQYNCKQNREMFTKISETTVESSQDASNPNKNNSNGNNSNFGSDTFNDNTSSSSNDSQNNKDELTIDSQNTTEMLIKDENISNNNDKNKNNMNGQNNGCSSNGSSKRKKSSSSNKQGSSFFCDVCKASFNQKIHLTKHSAKHTGIKPFKCTECNYSTVERSHLKVHVRVHTGEKPFKCTFCEYATAQSSTLKIHKKRHHDNLDESNQKSNTISEKNYESLISGTISSLLSNDASKINQSSSILPPIFSLLPSKKSNDEEKNMKNENNIENDLKDTNNKNEKNLETSSTTSNCTVGQENSDIYKNKKNLPPVKRFKIFHHLNSTHCIDEQDNVSIKLESSNNNSNNNTISSSNDNSTENKQENNDNKLLGLANIALERETS